MTLKKHLLGRRDLLKTGGVALFGGWESAFAQAKKSSRARAIPALLPRDAGGHQLVVYADCCSGLPGKPNEKNFAAVNSKNFAAVNSLIPRLKPQPQFICFPGDNIIGGIKDYAALRAQWDYWLNTEMAWWDRKAFPIYNTTSNHNTYDVGSERVWREVFPEIPRNGPPDQEGLSYYVRRENLLLVCANTAFSGLGGYGHIESAWLDRVLTEQADATYKFVAGHHPAHALNGYSRYPEWRIVPDQGEAFWKVLVKHGVQAYLCSHILAFDVQVHDGVLQITTGGAGTVYGPGGLMPARTEYLHIVQMAVDRMGLRYQVLDTSGAIREWLEWPFSAPSADQWEKLTPEEAPAKLGAAWKASKQKSGDAWLCAWRFSGNLKNAPSGGDAQTLLCGWENSETVPAIWIGIEGCPPRLTVRLLPESGAGAQVWTGPRFTDGQAFDFQLGIHSGMGPGGILYRRSDQSPWSSLISTSAQGAEELPWPRSWVVGCSQSGPSDRPFLGETLRLSWWQQVLPKALPAASGS